MTARKSPEAALERTLRDARACRVCAAELPLGPRPIVRARATARLLIVGQAPGTRVHETGIPWNDPSGERLRDWLAVDRETFFDQARIAIMPMGFCYPGRDPRGGDNPPRPECAPLWHPPLLAALPAVELAGRESIPICFWARRMTCRPCASPRFSQVLVAKRCELRLKPLELDQPRGVDSAATASFSVAGACQSSG